MSHLANVDFLRDHLGGGVVVLGLSRESVQVEQLPVLPGRFHVEHLVVSKVARHSIFLESGWAGEAAEKHLPLKQGGTETDLFSTQVCFRC